MTTDDRKEREATPRARRSSGDEPEASAYQLDELTGVPVEPTPFARRVQMGVQARATARALDATPAELRAALHGQEGPFTAEHIRGSVLAYRQREIPAG